MPKKRVISKTKVQELSEKLDLLLDKRLLAYKAGTNHTILDQLETMIQMTQMELYDEKALQDHKNEDSDDGESFIV